jgi:malate dehydrogenase (oxaloacetate-decarboxylating)(NADP+)
LGAGSAGLGVVNSIFQGMVLEGLTVDQARKNFWLVDHEGLLSSSRFISCSSQQREYCRLDWDSPSSLLEVVRTVKPTILLGLSGAARTFTKEVIQEMSKHVERPIIFPMSNPTSLAECTAQEAFEWSNGKCLFASGSPFDPVEMNGKTYYTSQGNNMYIFPGIGLGAVACQATKITDSMFYIASKTLAKTVSNEEIARGQVYPDITQIREVSKRIAVEVCKIAFKEKLARIEEPENLEEFVSDQMYTPYYAPIVTNV